MRQRDPIFYVKTVRPGFDVSRETAGLDHAAVAVPMVDVRRMGMPVGHRLMPVAVAVRLARRVVWRVGVLVVLVVDVTVLVFKLLVAVLVIVGFCDV